MMLAALPFPVRTGVLSMNFEFSDDQKLLKQQANKFLTDRCTLRDVRKILESDQPFHRDLWNQVASMGWTSTAIPEEFGGLGLGHLELCVVAEEIGRALAPIPFSSSVYVATEALLLAGSQQQKEHYLPKLAAGELIGTFAVAEGPGNPDPASYSVSYSNGKLSGAKIPVIDGDIADFAVVIAKSGQGASLCLVDLTDPSVKRTTLKTLDPTRSQAHLVFNDTPATLLGQEGAGARLLDQVFNRAAVLYAFEQIGGAEQALHQAREYAMGRYAFGRPIASFQALKHKMADMYVALELARSNGYYGAWALSTNAPELPLAAATARVSATKAMYECARENIQIHGGMGFTWEFDCHMFYRRAKLLSLVIGSQNRWEEKLIQALTAGQAA